MSISNDLNRLKALSVGEDTHLVNSLKIRNSILRELVDSLKNSNISHEYIISFLLTLDEALERGLINDDFLNNLKNDPNFISNLLNNGGNSS